jgi:hypothetical protein
MKRYPQEKIDKIKEQFYGLIKEKGFTGLRAFARATNIQVGNIYSNIDGRYELGIKRAFIYANALNVPITDILAIFYEDEMAENYKSAS